MATPTKDIDLESIAELRSVSLAIASYLTKRLQANLTTVTPLFSPRRVLGEYMQSAFSDRVPGAEANFAAVEQRYKRLAKHTFNVPSRLDTPVENIKNQLVAVPWVYPYQLGGRTVTITSPVRWIITYADGYALSDVISRRAHGQDVDPESVRAVLLRSLTLWRLLDESPALMQLFEDLRFPFSFAMQECTDDLPFVVAACDVPAFRPQEDAIEKVLALSGKPVFEELIDVNQLEAIGDPFKVSLLEMVSR